ncbi:MAG: carboxypeptidase regulatory-like domain-containing protein [Bacteroidales bacterium]|nr:carboxypeptidase regulatory-like domain-containing protein [Bacteroidales bacterium]
MKRISFLSIAFAIIFYSSCKKEYDVKMNQTVKMTIQGYIYDEASAIPIANATVSWPGGSVTSDANGFFTVSNMSPGTMTFTVAADSFATMFKTLEMEAYSASDKYVESMVIYMYRLNQTLETRVFMNMGSLYKPVSNVPYQIDLGTGFLNRIIRGVTDAEGNISQDNLPDTYLELRVDFEEDGSKYGLNTYYGYIMGYARSFESAVFVEEIENTGSLLISASNILDEEGMPVTDFNKSDNITFEFTAPVDLEYTSTTIELRNSNGYEIATNITWSNNNKNLTIDPVGDSLTVEGEYYVYMLLRGEDGSYLNNYSNYQTFEFIVEGEETLNQLGKVGTLELEYPETITNTTYYIRIRFPEVEGVYRYEIFGQYDNGEYLYLGYHNDYTVNDDIVTTSNIYLDGLPGISVPTGGLFSGGNVYKIIVRAAVSSSSNIVGPFSDPLILSAGAK